MLYFVVAFTYLQQNSSTTTRTAYEILHFYGEKTKNKLTIRVFFFNCLDTFFKTMPPFFQNFTHKSKNCSKKKC